MRLSRRLVGLLLVVGAMVPGCAEQVQDVDRIQPHYVEKALLEGDWYYRQTIVDVPPQTSFAFTGIEGGLAKIRWEVREDFLIAFRIHETVPGVDELESRPGATFKGDPVASFAITDHFDIIRDVNLQTGEQSNVLTEDRSLNPWYKRKYMRVDWTSNSVPDAVDFGGLLEFVAGLTGGTSEWIRETDKFDPNRMRLEDDFIQFTVQYSYALDSLETCYYEYGQGALGFENCGEVELRLRHSFVKIPADADKGFVPRKYFDRELLTDDSDGDGAAEPIRYTTVSVGPDKNETVDVACTPEVLEKLGPDVTLADCRELQWDQQGRFGFFRTERHGFERRVGPGNDNLRQYFANHHSIWKQAIGDDGKVIPESQRQLRPIVYYLNPTFPEDLIEETVKLGRDWNEAFMTAAVEATGKSRSAIESQLRADFEASGQRGTFLADDYGPEALYQIRRNNCSIPGIRSYVRANPDMAEVLEEVAETTNPDELLPGHLERVCAGLVFESRERGLDDKFDWQQIGDLRFSHLYWVNENSPGGPLGYGPSSADPENGHIISGNAYIYGAALDSYARSAADIIRVLNGEFTLDGILDGDTYLNWIQNSGTNVADMDMKPTAEMKREMSRRIGTDQVPGRDRFMKNGKIDPAEMMRHMQKRLQQPKASDPARFALQAPTNPGRQRLEQLKQDPEFRAKLLTPEILAVVGPLFGWHEGEEMPPKMVEFATNMAVNPTAYSKWVRARERLLVDNCVYMADFLDDSVIGLALEMKDRDPEEVYQALRREIYRGVTLHEIGHTVGLTHNFQSSFDALNYHDEFWDIHERFPGDNADDERARNEAKITHYRYGSIMDYGSRFNSDFAGLGKYDYAAIKFVYGDRVEVFDDNVRVPGDLRFQIDFGDYRELPDRLGGAANLQKRKNVPIEDQMEKRRKGVLDNAQKYAQNPNRPASDFWIDRTVPYQYCADGFNGDLRCRTWDEGATHAEAVKSAIQRYWNYYVFNSYRRGRNEVEFINGFFSRQDRLAEYLVYPWKYYYFFDSYPTHLRDDLLEASLTGINFMNQVLGSPQPGRYCLDTRSNVFYPSQFFDFDTQKTCQSVELPVGQGRDMYIDFNDDYVYKIDYIGTFYDKTTFIFQLFDPSTSFFRISDQTDDRQFTVSYYNGFRDELVNLAKDLMQGYLGTGRSNSNFAYYLDRQNKVVPSLMIDPETFGKGGQRPPNTRPRIYAPVPYNLLYNTMLYASAFGTTMYDRQLDFIDYLQIGEEGSGDDRLCGASAQAISFTNPTTGATFNACQTNDGRSLAYDIIKEANDYVREEWQPAYDAWQRNLESPRAEEFRQQFEDADQRLQDFVELMQDMRSLRSLFDWGRL